MLRPLKVEAGINGLLPTSWVPSIYSVSLLIRLRLRAGGGYGLLRSSVLRSFLAPAAEPKTKVFDSRTEMAKMLEA